MTRRNRRAHRTTGCGRRQRLGDGFVILANDDFRLNRRSNPDACGVNALRALRDGFQPLATAFRTVLGDGICLGG